MPDLTHFILALGLLIIGCVASSKLSSRFSLPSLLVFLIIGLAASCVLETQGQSGFLVNEALTWRTANGAGTIALVFILFAGGYDSNWKDFKPVLIPGALLATAGVLLTTLFMGGGFFAILHRAVPDGNSVTLLCLCLLLGAIVSSTDASAVFSILRSKKIGLKVPLRPLMELESGSNDPMATFLTLTILAATLNIHAAGGSAGAVSIELLKAVPFFAWKMSIGVLTGIIVGKIAVWLFNHINLEYDGLYYVMGIGIVLLTYALAVTLKANGFMAAYAAGMWMGNHKFVFRNSFGRFSDALAWLMQVVLFTMLGFKANPHILWQLKWVGVASGLALMFFARPLAVFLTLWDKKFSPKAKLLVSWVGLRGGAPIMLATFPMLDEYKTGMTVSIAGTQLPMAELMFNLVFFMVLLSVVFQSFTIMPLAKTLLLDAPLANVPTAPLSFDQTAPHKVDANTEISDDYADNHTEEYIIEQDSELAGRKLADLGLPHGVFVVMVRRGTRYIIPRGNTLIEDQDCLTIFGTPAKHKETALLFASHKNR